MQSSGITDDGPPNITPKTVYGDDAYQRQGHTENKNHCLAFAVQHLPDQKSNIHCRAQLSFSNSAIMEMNYSICTTRQRPAMGCDNQSHLSILVEVEEQLIIPSLFSESRLPVGSSAKTISGSLIKARQMATRCCSPPESCSGKFLPRCPSPTRSRRSCAFFRHRGLFSVRRETSRFQEPLREGIR